jgi:hypothetical protein
MMRKPLGAIVLVLVALSAIPVLAQKSGWASDSDPTVKYIVESERKWAESNCAEQPDLKNIIADDFQGTAPSGKRFGKAEAIATDATALDNGCQLDDAKVRYFGDNLAMVYGSERSMRKAEDGKENMRCLIWTDTWLKRNGKWQIIAAQDTAVQCK